MIRTAILLITSSLVAACGSEAPPQPKGLKVTVSSLQLDAVDDVVYGLRVLAGDEVVWEQSGISSTRYGDGAGAITYIGTCDASHNPHTVELVVERVVAGGRDLVDPTDWVNPAPAGRPIRRMNVTCVENADTLVAFDLTIMRAAIQGFLDIAVNFDDIFCSAKVDCKDAFLHQPNGERGATVITTLACTSGVGQPTFMYMSDVVITCDDASPATPPVVFTIPSSGQQVGQHGPVTGAPGGVAGIFGWGLYQDQEDLTSNGQPIDKCFWNRTIGLDLAALEAAGLTHCDLSVIGTAASTLFSGGAIPGDSGAYPYISYDVAIWSAAEGLCDNQPLDGDSTGVTTVYATPDTVLSELAPLTGTYLCGDGGDLACPAPAQGAEAIRVLTEGSDLLIAHGDRTPTRVALPEGYTLGTTCCTDLCCTGQ